MEISEWVDDGRLAEVWPVMRQLRELLTEEEFQARVKKARSDGYRLFCALDPGPVGLVGWRIIHDLAFGRSLYIDDLVVDEGQRGNGIGTALLNFARSAALQEGCDMIRLTSAFRRTGAHAFYEQAGMDRAGYVFRERVGHRE